jgi:hypothetical protein
MNEMIFIAEGPNLRRIRLSPWTVVHEYCAMRFVEGTDPNDVANRVAFIEKTPRIRIFPFDHDHENDFRNWKYGPKGRGCPYDEDAARVEAYGFHPPSRDWCDRELLKLGYVLPDRDPWVVAGFDLLWSGLRFRLAR